ncbi:MAG: hypothetical protein O7F76_10445, partial [Planctomycetota bacterium]|nr:hypothetical protein [Planctomycetota bacterium]
MTQVAPGRREHLEPLVRRYASPILTFIHRMTRDVGRPRDSRDADEPRIQKKTEPAFTRYFRGFGWVVHPPACQAHAVATVSAAMVAKCTPYQL